MGRPSGSPSRRSAISSSGTIRGGIPERDLDALGGYWEIMPAQRAALFEPLRPNYCRLKLPLSEVKARRVGLFPLREDAGRAVVKGSELARRNGGDCG